MPYLDIHTHQQFKSTAEHISIQNELWPSDGQINPEALISVGVHPWYGKAVLSATELEEMAAVARMPAVKLIGECGLDRLKGEPLPIQIGIFEQQILLANRVNKPLIIHCVRCFDELIAIKNKMKVQVPYIIHGFNKSEQLARQLLAQGFYLSFGVAVLKHDTPAASLVEELPLDFFLETDDSEEPIERIYQQVADLRKITLTTLKDSIFANWKKINIL
jgi:TatD DNase family protein